MTMTEADRTIVEEWENDDIELTPEFLADLPQPTYWRVLVMPIKPKRMSRGGIALPESTQSAESMLNYIGKIVAVGDLVGKAKQLEGAYIPKVGEYVAYGQYAGQPIKYRGRKFVVVNDDNILLRIKDPSALTVYVG